MTSRTAKLGSAMMLLVGLSGCSLIYNADVFTDMDNDWWNTDYKSRSLIHMTPLNLAQPLLDVPILVTLDPTRINYTHTAGDGRDLRFVSITGTPLAHEVERWNPEGRSSIWVKLPEIQSGQASKFWLYYNNPAAPMEDRAPEVWNPDNIGIWHLSEQALDPENPHIHRDATGRGNHGMSQGNRATDTPEQVIGYAQEFDGVDDFIEIDSDDLRSPLNALTVQVRAFAHSPIVEFPHLIGAGDSDRIWQLWWVRRDNAWAGRFRVAGTLHSVFSNAGNTGVWSNLALVYDGSVVRLYLDGSLLGSSAPGTGPTDALDSPVYIGSHPGLAARNFYGYVDEVRIAGVTRSPDWIRVQHMSMNDSLLTYSPAESCCTEP